MSNSVDPDETEPSHLDLCCLQKPIIIACGSERLNYLLTSQKTTGCVTNSVDPYQMSHSVVSDLNLYFLLRSYLIAPDKRGYPSIFFSYFSIKTYVVGTH